VKRVPDVRVARIYEPPALTDGARVLVDGLWPRGIAKSAAALDDWCKQVAPSADLRRWYGHDSDRFEEFTERYEGELSSPVRAAAFAGLEEMSRRRTLTLLTATKDLALSHATVLAGLIGKAL
jgi:uncharacterized protein YeaO (DUF488 family)